MPGNENNLGLGIMEWKHGLEFQGLKKEDIDWKVCVLMFLYNGKCDEYASYRYPNITDKHTAASKSDFLVKLDSIILSTDRKVTPWFQCSQHRSTSAPPATSSLTTKPRAFIVRLCPTPSMNVPQLAGHFKFENQFILSNVSQLKVHSYNEACPLLKCSPGEGILKTSIVQRYGF